MLYILFIIFICLFIGGGLLVYDDVLGLPSHRTAAALTRAINAKKTTFRQRIFDSIVKPPSLIIEPFIKFSSKREALLLSELKRADFNVLPSQYYAESIAWSLLLIPFALIFAYLQNKLLMFFCIIAIPLVFYILTHKHLEVLKKKKEEIELVLPSFIRSILYKLSDDSSGVVKADLISIFSAYLKVCPEAFLYDISQLVFDLKTKDVESSLRAFNTRLGIPEVSYLVNALIGLHRGEHQTDVFASLAKDMSVKNKNNIKRELDKRPRKVVLACIPLFILAFIAIGYVLVSSLLQGFSSLL